MTDRELLECVPNDPFILSSVTDDKLETLLGIQGLRQNKYEFLGFVLAEWFLRKWLKCDWEIIDLEIKDAPSFQATNEGLESTFEDLRSLERA